MYKTILSNLKVIVSVQNINKDQIPKENYMLLLANTINLISLQDSFDALITLEIYLKEILRKTLSLMDLPSHFWEMQIKLRLGGINIT